MTCFKNNTISYMDNVHVLYFLHTKTHMLYLKSWIWYTIHTIYTLSLCHGHSWRVRLAKQETLTPPGHLVSPLVYRGP